MKIGYVTVDWSPFLGPDGKQTPGGAGYYRMVSPARALAANGVETIIGNNIGALPGGGFAVKGEDGKDHDDCEVIVLQRWMDATGPEHIRRARAAGQIIVNDCDDWYDGLDSRNIAFRSTHPRNNPEANRNHYRAILGASSALTVSTHYLASRLERINSNIIVVPNAIDLERWKVRDVTGPPIIGWVGAVGFRSGDLEELRGVLSPFLVRHGIPFHHSGHADGQPHASAILGLSETIRASRSPMADIYNYPDLFARFNIGIVPLRYTPFNMAKSSIKGLEYGACGIPFVASSTAEYQALAAHGGGFVARRPRDWNRRLERLLDPDERRDAGQSARVAAERHSMADNWVAWRNAYTTLLAAV